MLSADRRQHAAGAHARRLRRHQPWRTRRRPRDRRRGHVRPCAGRGATRRSPGWSGPTQPRRDSGARRCSASTSRARRDLEMSRGVVLPVHAYPLFENALRAANGWTLVGARGADRGAVVPLQRGGGRQPVGVDPHGAHGVGDRHARRPTTGWSRSPTPSCARPTCRWTRVPGYIVCSVEAARSAGVPEERWVFPLAGADAQRPLVHLRARRAVPLPRHPPGRWRRARRWPAWGSTTWRRSTSIPASPSWCRWRRAELGLADRRPVPAADADRRADLRRGPGEQLHVARDRPRRRRRCARRRARRRW